MTDKEKIKAIIKQYADKGERLYNESCETKEDSQTIGYWDGYRDCANLLLRELDTTQEEKVSIWHDASEKSNEPEEVVIINPSDNTGEVVTRCTGVYQGRIWAYTSVLLNLDNPCKNRKKLQEEPVSEDYEKALNSVAITFLQEQQIIPNFYADIIMKAVKRGVKWQKEQMMKGAIETSVCAMLDGIHIDILPKQLKGCRFGEKVKVIIIKED